MTLEDEILAYQSKVEVITWEFEEAMQDIEQESVEHGLRLIKYYDDSILIIKKIVELKIAIKARDILK